MLLKLDKMKIKILKNQMNKLFSRREITFSTQEEITPSNKEVKEVIAKEFSVDKSLIRIRKIGGKFGSKVFTIVADIYTSQEEFNRVVKKTKQEVEAEKKAKEERLETEARVEADKAEVESTKEESN